MNLSNEDIKIIKNEKRVGYVFSGLILAFGGIGNIVYWVSETEKVFIIIALINLLLIAASFLIPFFMNRKYNLDLKEGEKIVKTEIIQKKGMITDYEVGSGSLYIPILGDLFPKLWGQKMKEIQKYTVILNGTAQQIEKNLFEIVNEGDGIEMHFSKHSQILLKIQKGN